MKPYHGEIKILSSSECIKLLEKSRFGHLACSIKDEIYLVPITFVYEDGYIYSHSKVGKKIEIMRKNSKVCVQVEDVQDFFRWQSVILWGHFEELAGDIATMAMRHLIKKIIEKERDQRRSELEVDFSALLESSIIFRVKVERSTGRSEGWSN